jgi:hypothetical protein
MLNGITEELPEALDSRKKELDSTPIFATGL